MALIVYTEVELEDGTKQRRGIKPRYYSDFGIKISYGKPIIDESAIDNLTLKQILNRTVHLDKNNNVIKKSS